MQATLRAQAGLAIRRGTVDRLETERGARHRGHHRNRRANRGEIGDSNFRYFP